MHVIFGLRLIQLIMCRIRIFSIRRVIEADARIYLLEVRRYLCVVFIIQVNRVRCWYLLFGFNGGTVHTTEHEATTGQTSIASNAPVLC